jgi:hypothetical protein
MRKEYHLNWSRAAQVTATAVLLPVSAQLAEAFNRGSETKSLTMDY